MKRTVVALVLGLSLALWPFEDSVAETRVYVSFSIGGAVIVGGGLLIWSLTYASQVSQFVPRIEHSSHLRFEVNEPNPQAAPSLIGSFTGVREGRETTATDLFVEKRPEPVPPPLLELPLLVFRW